MQKKHEILLGLTTTPASDWRGKVEEMKKFGIKRIALFPTFLGIEERRELYKLLEQIEGLEIPHVHLRNQDMEAWEMELFEQKFQTQYYNIHTNKNVNSALEKYKQKIYIENHFNFFDEGHLNEFGGICLDTQHLRIATIKAPRVCRQTLGLLEKYPVGCCHISALPKPKSFLKRLLKRLWGHYLLSLEEVDYIGEYKKYLPEYISLELENSFEGQLEVKKYIEEKILV